MSDSDLMTAKQNDAPQAQLTANEVSLQLAPQIAKVILPIPLDQPYSYLVPKDFAEDAQVGCRVLVPFGPRRMTGLIVERGEAEEEPSFKLKPILDVLDNEPAFTDELLWLTRWIAEYYACSWGEVVKAALPTGTGIEEERRIVRTEALPGVWRNHAAARALLRYLDDEPEATLADVQRAIDGVSMSLLRRMERDGVIEQHKELVAPKVTVKHEKHLRFAPAFRHPSAVKDLTVQLRGKKQIAVVETVAGFAAAGTRAPRQADVFARAEAAYSTVGSLVDRGILEVVEKEVLRTPLGDLGEPLPTPKHALHAAQQRALDAIGGAVEAGRFETFLLHGVTGSGKTEVYIAALKRVLAQGRTGIILVPEIALTPQTVQRFRAHFGDRIAVLHSRMSLGERFDAWRSLRSGRYDVVIGPRSAILAPLSNVGLIVVDEEHEPSYKQFDPAPRYHARDVAVMRAHRSKAVCILGSATPSLETTVNARAGKYTLLEMPERVPVPGHEAAPLPDIRIVDLTLERKKHRLDGALSETLREAIRERLDRREQVILLQNRRGYAPVIECKSCGWAPMCHDCSVTLTYHKTKRHLRCHYCGRAERMVQKCPDCHALDLAWLGQGTQRVEEELQTVFPEARILRMDLDTTGRKNAHHTILDKFGRGDADILIGTQMVAKGLDFSRVTLVGVVNADTGMRMPDFRAEERTFQLLTQVAGRAGRAALRGEVILQTRSAEHSVFRYILAHDYHGFADAVLPERHQLGYPPFGRVVGIEFKGPKQTKVEELARNWTAALCKQAGVQLQIMGPEPALVGRVKRQYRYHTIIKAPRGAAGAGLQELLKKVNKHFGKPPKGYRLSIDVDAMGLF